MYLHSTLITILLSLTLTACQVDVSAPNDQPAQAEAPLVESTTAGDEEESPAAADADIEEASTDAPEASASDDPAAALITAFAQPSETIGDVLVLYGQVIDVNGNPITDAVVEIWQTDATGIYDHPDDPGTSSRDMTFQFYGITATDSAGWYAFRTIVPGRYEPRPRHIHYKVKQGQNTLLTSQFYFSDDIAEVEGEGMFQAVGESGDLLLLQLVQGEGHLLAYGQIVVDTGIGSGELPLTPSQATGPYYPVVDLATYDNDLVALP